MTARFCTLSRFSFLTSDSHKPAVRPEQSCNLHQLRFTRVVQTYAQYELSLPVIISDMNATEVALRANNVSENRFRRIFLTFRLAGISLNMHTTGRIHGAYNVMIAVSFYITYISGFMDLLVSTGDLKELMKGSRVIFGLSVVAWQQLFLR